jgi:hypothetical protein
MHSAGNTASLQRLINSASEDLRMICSASITTTRMSSYKVISAKSETVPSRSRPFALPLTRFSKSSEEEPKVQKTISSSSSADAHQGRCFSFHVTKFSSICFLADSESSLVQGATSPTTKPGLRQKVRIVPARWKQQSPSALIETTPP